MAYADYQLSDLQSRLTERIESSNFVATAELTLAINEAIRIWNLYTATWRRRVTHALQVESDPYFALPQTITFATRMQATNTPMTKSSIHDLNYGRPNWLAETVADGGSVPTTPSVWAPASLTLIAYWPKVTATGTTLTIDAVSAAPVLSNAGDYIDIDPARVNTILGYAQHYLSLKRGSTELAKTMHLHKAMIKAAGDENDLFRESSFYRWALLQDDKLVHAPLHAPTKGEK